jgi:hypothetical protein
VYRWRDVSSPYWVYPYLIAFEGPSCSFKTTLAEVVAVELDGILGGVEVFYMGRRNRVVRRFIESASSCYELQARYREYFTRVAPRIMGRGKIVVVDRWVASHVVYSAEVIGSPSAGFWARVPLPYVWVLVYNDHPWPCLNSRSSVCMLPEFEDYEKTFERFREVVRRLAGETGGEVIEVAVSDETDIHRWSIV